MKLELDINLCNTFPEIFSDRHENKELNAMSWGFECGDGWHDVIHNLCVDIMSYCNSTGYPVPRAAQVKEKYGTLRFYVDQGDDHIYDLIEHYSTVSRRTCETCGKIGRMRGDGWMTVSCEEHARKY